MMTSEQLDVANLANLHKECNMSQQHNVWGWRNQQWGQQRWK
jgi:hypothetical protein